MAVQSGVDDFLLREETKDGMGREGGMGRGEWRDDIGEDDELFDVCIIIFI